MRGRVKSGVESILGILNLFYWAVLLWAGILMLVDRWETGESTEILKVSVVPFRGVWVFALILMCLLLLFRLIHHLRGLIKGGEKK